ncbi:hypothetical protein L13192_04663 [Pyrenophora tritici-repentis]|nr:hypothetical protein L13192_04663 [Pyrenophora tritici-repentis]
MAHTQPQPQPTLLLSAPHLPLATALTSTVPLPALAVIQWCVFENRNRSEVMALYNASGYGTHYTPSGVYKIMRKYGPIWFNEQQVRRPWGLYFSEEKAELIRRGWGKDDLVMAGAGGVADEMVVDPLAGWVAGPGKKRVRRSRVVRFEEEDDESTAGASSAESSRSESPVSDHRSFESPSVEDHPVVHQDIGVPIPEELKVAIQEKHNEWLEANKTGRADIADPLEEQLADLERQAMEVNAGEFIGRYTHALETASKRKPQAATSSAASDGPPNSAQDATNEVEIIEDSDEIEGGQSAKKSKTTARKTDLNTKDDNTHRLGETVAEQYTQAETKHFYDHINSLTDWSSNQTAARNIRDWRCGSMWRAFPGRSAAPDGSGVKITISESGIKLAYNNHVTQFYDEKGIALMPLRDRRYCRKFAADAKPSSKKPKNLSKSLATPGLPDVLPCRTDLFVMSVTRIMISPGLQHRPGPHTGDPGPGPASRTQEKAKLVRLLADKQWLSGRNTFIFNFDRKTKDPGQRRRSLRSKWAIQMRRFSGSSREQ